MLGCSRQPTSSVNASLCPRVPAASTSCARLVGCRHYDCDETSRTTSDRPDRLAGASVLGANDGILSTSSLVLGVASAHATRGNILVAGVAGLVAGAMSMAAGEYVSVHSQADTEKAELEVERKELASDDKGEHRELAAIYVGRGLERSLAKRVAQELMAHDALGRTRAMNWGLPRRLRLAPFRPRSRRPPVSRREQRCLCSWLSSSLRTF